MKVLNETAHGVGISPSIRRCGTIYSVFYHYNINHNNQGTYLRPREAIFVV